MHIINITITEVNQNIKPLSLYFGSNPSTFLGPVKFLGNNFNDKKPHNRKENNTKNEKKLGHIFVEITVYFFNKINKQIGTIMMNNIGAK